MSAPDSPSPAKAFDSAIQHLTELIVFAERLRESWFVSPDHAGENADRVKEWVARSGMAPPSQAPTRSRKSAEDNTPVTQAVPLNWPPSPEWEAGYKKRLAQVEQRLKTVFQELRGAGAKGLPDAIKPQFSEKVSEAETAAFATTRLPLIREVSLDDWGIWVRPAAMARQSVADLARDFTAFFELPTNGTGPGNLRGTPGKKSPFPKKLDELLEDALQRNGNNIRRTLDYVQGHTFIREVNTTQELLREDTDRLLKKVDVKYLTTLARRVRQRKSRAKKKQSRR